MADDKQNTDRSRNIDRSLINLSEDYEVQYWTSKFEVTKEELQRAVDAVGSSAKKVEAFFKN